MKAKQNPTILGKTKHPSGSGAEDVETRGYAVGEASRLEILNTSFRVNRYIIPLSLIKSDIVNWFVKQPTLTSILLGFGGIVCLVVFCIIILILGPIIGVVLGVCGVGMAIWGAGVMIQDICTTRKLAKKVKNKDLLLD